MRTDHPDEFTQHTEFSHLHRFSSNDQYFRYMKSIFKSEKQFLTEIFLQLAVGSKILPLDYRERNSHPATHFEMFLVVQGLAKRNASYSDKILIREAFGFDIITYFRILFDAPIEEDDVRDLYNEIAGVYDLKGSNISSFIKCIQQGVDPDSMEDYFNLLSSEITSIDGTGSETYAEESSSPRPGVYSEIQECKNRIGLDTVLPSNDPSCRTCANMGEVKVDCGGTQLSAAVGMCDTLEYISSLSADMLPDAAIIVPHYQIRKAMTVINDNWEVRQLALSHGKYTAGSTAELFQLIQSGIKCYLLICTSPCVLPYVRCGYLTDCKRFKDLIKRKALIPRYKLYVDQFDLLLERFKRSPPNPREPG